MVDNNIPTPPRIGSEQSRISDQYRVMGKLIDLLPEKLDATKLYKALDLLCGEADWCIDVARAYEIPCIGLDVREMIEAGQAHTHLAGVADLVSFKEMDRTQPLPFSDEEFDVVYAQDLSRVLPRVQWPFMLRECCRILKDSGYLVLVETLLPKTNMPAFKELTQRLARACWKAGIGLSEEVEIEATSHILLNHMKSVYQQVRVEAYLLDLSCSGEQYTALQNFWHLFVNWQPFLTQMFEGNQPDIYRLCDQFAVEVYEETFEAEAWIVRVWGQKQKNPGFAGLPPSMPTLNEENKVK
jgi:ubiquinone/menaquinone biosynthesis C-methylase UbiE